jgi:hypothetical protein
VHDHFKPKKPEPKEPVDPAGKKFSLHDVLTKAERTPVEQRSLDHKVMQEEE